MLVHIHEINLEIKCFVVAARDLPQPFHSSDRGLLRIEKVKAPVGVLPL